MDATEAQLRFGASLTHSTDPSHPLHPFHLGTNPPPSATSLGGLSVLSGSSQTRTRIIDSNASNHNNTTRIVGFSSNPENQRNFDRDNYAQSSRREFLTYALSLMRSHSSEHRDSLPVLDITALRHIAYVVDGIVYYMRAAKESDDKSDNNYLADPDENENDDTEDELQMNCDNDSLDDDVLSGVPGSRHIFFQRSESTLCLGCPPPDPFNAPMAEALPLADQPHLLQPNANREDLFGIPKQPVTVPTNGTSTSSGFSPLEVPPTRLGMSSMPRSSNSSSAQDVNFVYVEAANDTTGQHDVAITPDNTEKQDKLTRTNDDEEVSTKSAHTQSLSTISTEIASMPGTSKEQTGRRPPECFNIYMQLKKKTYFDFHDEDTKNNADAEKRDDGPQDLSCAKSNTDSTKMEIDDDYEISNETDLESRNQFGLDATQGSQDTSTSNTAIRPQIIVSPKKVNTFSESTKSYTKGNKESGLTNDADASANLQQPHPFGESSTSNAAGQSGSNSSSPSKSVIVRAGPSVSINQ